MNHEMLSLIVQVLKQSIHKPGYEFEKPYQIQIN